MHRHPAKQGIYLNETATVIWRLCDGSRSVDDIISVLTEAYPDMVVQVTSDVQNAIDRLVRLGAIKFVDSAQPVTPLTGRGDTGSASEAEYVSSHQSSVADLPAC
jgi:hypothetical protein